MNVPAASRRAVFLDRDGVLSVEIGDYITHPDALQLLPGAAAAVARLQQAGWPVIVFTNQAGVGRGRFTLETLDAIHVRLREGLAVVGGELTALYSCPHHPDDDCECRKPRPGMLLQAAREHALDLTACYVVGDSPRDLAAGQAVGCRTVLVLTGHTSQYDLASFPSPQPDHVFPDLPTFTDWLIQS